MKFNKKNLAALLLAAVAFTGCEKEDLSKQHYDNKLFISAKNVTEELLIKTTSSYEREIVAGVAQPVEQAIKVEFAAAPELYDHYCEAFYDKEAIILPEQHYEFTERTTEIQPGSVLSMPVKIKFVDVNLLDKSQRYVLPVTISSVEGISLLNSARTVYYIFKGAALINVVADIAENRAWPEWKNGSEINGLGNFTLEALICGNAFKNQISTIMGIEGKFLVRIGDAGVAPNQIQIASNSNLTNSDLRLDPGVWYHVAVTFDMGNVKVYINGTEKCSGNVGSYSVDLGTPHSDESNGQPRCFWIGYSYDNARYFDGTISEVRIWKKTLTAEEINAPDHFYQVDPASEGLFSYWKFDEGAGKTIKDHTSNGNDLTVERDLKWVDVSLPEMGK